MNLATITNPVLEKLPKHLLQFVLPQHYERYTPINQAVWRYVMRRNSSYLKKVAHEAYTKGLDKTGISIDNIPSMYGMNRILKEIGWAAVAVDGLIPSDAFMEFQAYNVLVIASEIRQIGHIEYTPAPDIIHESAGHAPIIAIPEYAEYLRRFGEIGCKAISSKKENELYGYVRQLAVLKETKGTPQKEIDAVEETITHLQNNMGEPSEMQQIRNLHWWTVEYGLIGDLKNPKIYGAGLLSSIGESKWCLSDQVKKIPYTIEAAKQNFDVTRPQPQLFVTPHFAHLSSVLEEYANMMSLRRGGLRGVEKLIGSSHLGTIELSTGLQISGHFERVIKNERGEVAFIKTTGPTALSYREKELIGHSIEHHPNGYVSPLGRLKGINLAIEDMSPRDLEAYNIYEEKKTTLHFEGGISLTGEVITGTRNVQGKILVIAFKNCLIQYQDEVLFEPNQGIYYLAVGKSVVAAFAGPADHDSFDLITHELSDALPVVHKTEEEIAKEKLYQEVRDIREGKIEVSSICALRLKAEKAYPREWLLMLEIYEIAKNRFPNCVDACLNSLKDIQTANPGIAHLITAGLKLS